MAPPKKSNKISPSISANTWWTIIGSLIIFSSWVAKDFFKTKMDGRIYEYSTTRQKLSNFRLTQDLYELQIKLVENIYLKDSSSKEDLLHAYFLFSNNGNEMIRLISEYLDDEAWKENNIVGYYQFKDYLNSLEQKKDLDGLKNTVQKIHSYDSIFTPKALHQFNTMDFNNQKSSECWNWAYLIFYIVGSACLGIAYIKFLKKKTKG